MNSNTKYIAWMRFFRTGGTLTEQPFQHVTSPSFLLSEKPDVRSQSDTLRLAGCTHACLEPLLHSPATSLRELQLLALSTKR